MNMFKNKSPREYLVSYVYLNDKNLGYGHEFFTVKKGKIDIPLALKQIEKGVNSKDIVILSIFENK